MCVCVCVCVRACMRACVRACVREWVCIHECVYALRTVSMDKICLLYKCFNYDYCYGEHASVLRYFRAQLMNLMNALNTFSPTRTGLPLEQVPWACVSLSGLEVIRIPDTQ